MTIGYYFYAIRREGGLHIHLPRGFFARFHEELHRRLLQKLFSSVKQWSQSQFGGATAPPEKAHGSSAKHPYNPGHEGKAETQATQPAGQKLHCQCIQMLTRRQV